MLINQRIRESELSHELRPMPLGYLAFCCELLAGWLSGWLVGCAFLLGWEHVEGHMGFRNHFSASLG